MREHVKHRFPGGLTLPSRHDAEEAEKAGSANRKPDKVGRMTGQAMLLLLVQALFGVANALSGTFVNIYLWKTKGDYATIAWFAISHQLSMSLCFWLAGKWVKEHNKMNALRLGVGVAAIFYLTVLMLGTHAADYVLLLGMILGISSGLFWLAFNVVYFEVTDPENRDKFNGWAGLLGSLAGMIAPWLSGYIITHLPDATGYRIIFSISTGVFVVGVIVSFFLKKRKVSGHYDWLYGFRRVAERGHPWRRVGLALVAQGMREGVFGFLIGLLVYISTKNEMSLGNFSLITSAVGLVSFWLVGKLLKPRFRKIGMLVGVLAMIGVILPFFTGVSYTTLLIFGIGTAMFIPLYTIPITSTVFDIIGQDEESAKQRVEYIVLRELALNAGRFLGTLLFIGVLSVNSSAHTINGLMLAIGSSPLLAWIFIRKWMSGPQPANR